MPMAETIREKLTQRFHPTRLVIDDEFAPPYRP